MSVRSVPIIMWGISLPCKAVNYEDHVWPYKDGEKFDVLYDGMCQDYALFGKILIKGDEYQGMELTNLNEKLDEIDKDQVISDIAEEIGFDFDDLPTEGAIFAVTHWT